jgi:tetratricopeptide (TPR) repeat protein
MPHVRTRGACARVLTASFQLALAAATPVAAQHGDAPATPPPEYSTQPIPSSQVDAWRADLRALVDGLERVHPDPYAHTAKATIDSVVAALRDSIPALAAHQVVVGFARILALVGDGHTSLPLYFARGVDFHVMPYRLGVYEDGIHVEAADRAYADLVGGRVLTIGGVPGADALARVTHLISRDNDNWIAAVAPNLLNRIEVLHALAMAPDLAGVELTVNVDGRTVSRRVEPLPDPPRTGFGLPFLPRLTTDWVDARDAAGSPVPLYQRQYDDLYWWEYVPAHDMLYIKWDQVQNRQSGPTALATFREALAFARERRPARTVIDIRNNTGGEGGLLPPVIREIVRTREVDEPGSLFVVIGRRTFSAGQMMTAWLEQFSSAILVGEPSAAFYNGYAGHEFIQLPNSGIGVMVSPDYYQTGHSPRDARRQATPRLAAVPTFDDYRTNRDPAIEAILAYEPERFAREVLTALAAGDTTGAVARVRAYNSDPVNRYRDGSAELNALGYRLLGEGRQAQALAVFELNVRIHPRYANGWDSLGEAYVRAGRREDAIAAFRQALVIQPDLPPSLEWLRRLGVTH